MSIILQTMITNKLKQKRKLPFLGNKGMFIAGGESIIIEGAYPTSCKNDAQKKAMTYEYDNGLIDIALITNLQVMASIAKAGSVPVAAAITAANEENPVTKGTAPDPALLTSADEGEEGSTEAPELSGQAAEQSIAPNVVKGSAVKPVIVEQAKATAESAAPTEVVGTSTDAFASGSIEDNLPAAVPVGDGQTIPAKMEEPTKDMFGTAPAVSVKAEAGKIKPADAPKLTPVDGQGSAVAPKSSKPADSEKKTAPRRKPASRRKTGTAAKK